MTKTVNLAPQIVVVARRMGEPIHLASLMVVMQTGCLAHSQVAPVKRLMTENAVRVVQHFADSSMRCWVDACITPILRVIVDSYDSVPDSAQPITVQPLYAFAVVAPGRWKNNRTTAGKGKQRVRILPLHRLYPPRARADTMSFLLAFIAPACSLFHHRWSAIIFGQWGVTNTAPPFAPKAAMVFKASSETLPPVSGCAEATPQILGDFFGEVFICPTADVVIFFSLPRPAATNQSLGEPRLW